MSYKFIYIIREFTLLGEGLYDSSVNDELNKYGADKWELVNVIPHPKNKKNNDNFQITEQEKQRIENQKKLLFY